VADIKTERVLSLTTPTGFRSPGGGRPPVNTTRAERASGPAVRMGVRKWPARRHPLRLQRAEAPSQPDGHPIHLNLTATQGMRVINEGLGRRRVDR